jgi:hypothetical protein
MLLLLTTKVVVEAVEGEVGKLAAESWVPNTPERAIPLAVPRV